jgi:hypothetical protein
MMRLLPLFVGVLCLSIFFSAAYFFAVSLGCVLSPAAAHQQGRAQNVPKWERMRSFESFAGSGVPTKEDVQALLARPDAEESLRAVLEKTFARKFLDGPSYCIIARTYPDQLPNIPAFAFSLLSPRYLNTFIWLTPTDSDYDPLRWNYVVESLNNFSGYEAVYMSPFHPVTGKKRYDELLSLSGPWDAGYIMTDYMLDALQRATVSDFLTGNMFRDTPASLLTSPLPRSSLFNKSKVPHLSDVYWRPKHEKLCHSFMVTNADNLYHGNLFSATRPLLDNNDVVAFHFTSHYDLPGGPPQSAGGRITVAAGREVPSWMGWGGLDLGAAIVRADWFRQRKWTFIIDELERRTFAELRVLFQSAGPRFFMDRDAFLWKQVAATETVYTVVKQILLWHQ